MGGSCFPEIIPKLRRNLKTRLDEDPGLEGVFGDGARSKVRCKLGSKREEGNTREKETWAGSGGQGQTGTDSSSKQAVSWAKAGQTPGVAASLHRGFSRSLFQALAQGGCPPPIKEAKTLFRDSRRPGAL